MCQDLTGRKTFVGQGEIVEIEKVTFSTPTNQTNRYNLRTSPQFFILCLNIYKAFKYLRRVSRFLCFLAVWVFLCFFLSLFLIVAFAELRQANVSFVMSACLYFRLSVCLSVRPHGITTVPMKKFSLNLVF